MSNILLVTVLKIEAKAVLDVFAQGLGKHWERQFIGDKAYYNLGKIGSVNVFMLQSEMGSLSPGGALLNIHKAIAYKYYLLKINGYLRLRLIRVWF